MPEHQRVSIVVFEDRFAGDFARLNREWLDRYELYEEADDQQLYSPRQTILEPGGEIFIALNGGEVVGTCALVPVAPAVYEVAKLSVAQSARSEGLGRRLTERAIEQARALGATRVLLVSSTKLTAALRLYESLGFERKPLPEDLPYVTADVYMELELDGRS